MTEGYHAFLSRKSYVLKYYLIIVMNCTEEKEFPSSVMFESIVIRICIPSGFNVRLKLIECHFTLGSKLDPFHTMEGERSNQVVLLHTTPCVFWIGLWLPTAKELGVYCVYCIIYSVSVGVLMLSTLVWPSPNRWSTVNVTNIGTSFRPLFLLKVLNDVSTEKLPLGTK